MVGLNIAADRRRLDISLYGKARILQDLYIPADTHRVENAGGILRHNEIAVHSGPFDDPRTNVLGRACCRSAANSAATVSTTAGARFLIGFPSGFWRVKFTYALIFVPGMA